MWFAQDAPPIVDRFGLIDLPVVVDCCMILNTGRQLCGSCGSMIPNSVSPSNQSRVSMEVFHLHIKGHMASDMLISYQGFLTVRQNVECNSDVPHFFGHCISPLGITVLLVDHVSFSHIPRHFNSKLVSMLELASLAFLCEGDNSPTFLQNMMDPPINRIPGNLAYMQHFFD